VAYGAFVAQVGVLLHRIGRFGAATVIAYPAVLVAFLLLFTRSVALRLAGSSVSWRGRRVAVRA
jgi:4,4'-diaponeurosporenoate glycosyltransferase